MHASVRALPGQVRPATTRQASTPARTARRNRTPKRCDLLFSVARELTTNENKDRKWDLEVPPSIVEQRRQLVDDCAAAHHLKALTPQEMQWILDTPCREVMNAVHVKDVGGATSRAKLAAEQAQERVPRGPFRVVRWRHVIDGSVLEVPVPTSIFSKQDGTVWVKWQQRAWRAMYAMECEVGEEEHPAAAEGAEQQRWCPLEEEEAALLKLPYCIPQKCKAQMLGLGTTDRLKATLCKRKSPAAAENRSRRTKKQRAQPEAAAPAESTQEQAQSHQAEMEVSPDALELLYSKAPPSASMDSSSFDLEPPSPAEVSGLSGAALPTTSGISGAALPTISSGISGAPLPAISGGSGASPAAALPAASVASALPASMASAVAASASTASATVLPGFAALMSDGSSNLAYMAHVAGSAGAARVSPAHLVAAAPFLGVHLSTGHHLGASAAPDLAALLQPQLSPQQQLIALLQSSGACIQSQAQGCPTILGASGGAGQSQSHGTALGSGAGVLGMPGGGFTSGALTGTFSAALAGSAPQPTPPPMSPCPSLSASLAPSSSLPLAGSPGAVAGCSTPMSNPSLSLDAACDIADPAMETDEDSFLDSLLAADPLNSGSSARDPSPSPTSAYTGCYTGIAVDVPAVPANRILNHIDSQSDRHVSRLLSVAAATQALPCAPLQQAASASESSFAQLGGCDECDVPLPQWSAYEMEVMELGNDVCMALLHDMALLA